MAFYSDQASIFRVTASEAKKKRGATQFGRALSGLNIDILCANTPQAKGRVERAHLTLQGRLVKERRLCGIRDVEAANACAPEFIGDYNAGSREPREASTMPTAPCGTKKTSSGSSPGRRIASSRRT